MTHYWRMMIKFGPLLKCWCMRFGSMHVLRPPIFCCPIVCIVYLYVELPCFPFAISCIQICPYFPLVPSPSSHTISLRHPMMNQSGDGPSPSKPFSPAVSSERDRFRFCVCWLCSLARSHSIRPILLVFCVFCVC